MKKIIWGALATVSGVVLLFSYRTSLGESASVADAGTTASGSSGSTGSTGSTGTGDTSGSSGAASGDTGGSSGTGSSSGDSSTGGTTLQDGTFTGQTADTRWGAVQVAITVSGGKITAVDVPQYPNGNGRDAEINQRALPQLVSETLSAQSATIDMVSGATVTSDGYVQSLQSAIDEASQ